MSRFRKDIEGFANPTALPSNEEEGREWQNANRSWWESNPMRYDWRDPLAPAAFTREYFEAIDHQFFSAARSFMHWKEIPFDELIPFDALGTMDVLEVGVGSGSHAQLLATHARSFRGIDLTEFAVDSTRRRFDAFGLQGSVERMDAEKMDLPDASIDFAWSWGVIHHSSNPRRALEEIHRVLRPGGCAVIMVYYRSLWVYYLLRGVLAGARSGELFRGKSLHQIVQNNTDGALARYYSVREWRSFASDLFEIEEIRVLGQKGELIPLPGGRVKDAVLRLVPDGLSRLLMNRLRMGSFLVSRLRKPA